jgi:hypothetical protein
MNDSMMDFSAFDNAIDEQFKKDLKEAKENSASTDYPEIPKGDYVVKVDKMEIRPTKTGEPMFSCRMRITEGTFKNKCIFFNRKLFGNKVSDNWNDAKAIQTVVTWLDNLQTETIPEFTTYSDFNDVILDIFTECEQDKLTFNVSYDPKAFNAITINGVFEA